MQAARRSATASLRSISRNSSRPPSEDRRPPSNRPTTSFPAIGDRPGNGRVRSTMAGGRSGTGWIRFSNRILRDSDGLSYTHLPRCIIRASVLIQKFLSTLSLDGGGTAAKPFDGREDVLG